MGWLIPPLYAALTGSKFRLRGLFLIMPTRVLYISQRAIPTAGRQKVVREMCVKQRKVVREMWSKRQKVVREMCVKQRKVVP